MKTPLRQFRDAYLELLLRFLWREWTALGVPGQDRAPGRHVIDPEALLLFTCSLGRYDQRLFDEVLDWLTVNGRFLNVQRMKNILRQEPFRGGRVAGALADWLSRRGDPVKWKTLARTDTPDRETESLFFLSDGRPLPVTADKDPVYLAHGLQRNPVALRGYARTFSADASPCLILRLRALFGVNARCDILAYLVLRGAAHPREVSRELYYSQKAVHEVMGDLAASGFVHSVKGGRERTFRITSPGRPLLTGGSEPPGWINWPVLLSSAESVWKLVEDLEVAALEPLLVSAEIGLAVKPLLRRICQTSWAPAPGPFENQQGVPLLETFQTTLQSLLR